MDWNSFQFSYRLNFYLFIIKAKAVVTFFSCMNIHLKDGLKLKSCSKNPSHKNTILHFLLSAYNFVCMNTDQWIYIILLNSSSTQSWNWMSTEFLYLTTTSISILFFQNHFLCIYLQLIYLFQTKIHAATDKYLIKLFILLTWFFS